jgi:hypothetical protein
MKRYITVNAKDLNEVLVLIQNTAAVINIGNDAYNWLKKQLKNNQVAHNDQQANHQKELPHQGQYISFYLDENGQWMYVRHW